MPHMIMNAFVKRKFMSSFSLQLFVNNYELMENISSCTYEFTKLEKWNHELTDFIFQVVCFDADFDNHILQL